MDALRQVITSLSGLPGKKGLIYVSNGLEMVPGMELFYEFNRVTQDSAILTRMYEFDQTRAFANLAASANAQDVAFYAIDAAGLTMGGMSGAEFATAQDPLSASVGRHNLTDSLRFLADETGGIAIINTNDVAPRLNLITQDMFTYYSIGYPLQASGRDKVHKVKVKLRDDPRVRRLRGSLPLAVCGKVPRNQGSGHGGFEPGLRGRRQPDAAGGRNQHRGARQREKVASADPHFVSDPQGRVAARRR